MLDWIGCALAAAATGRSHPARRAAGNRRQAAGDRARPQAQARPARRAARQRPDGPRARLTTTPTWAAWCCTPVRRCSPRCSRWPSARRSAAPDLMLAYAVGFEAGVRSGRTAPGHHKGGWHLTGTLGSIAAGVAVRQAARSRRAAAHLRDGHRGDPGRRHAAEPRHHVQVVPRRQGGVNGVLAALLAERGFDFDAGDHRGQARLLAHLQRRRGARAS